MGFLSPIQALILEAGLGKARKEILTKQLLKNGGRIVELSALPSTSKVSFVLVGENVTYERAWKLLGSDVSEDTSVVIVRADWLSCCLKNGSVSDHTPFTVRPLVSDNNDTKEELTTGPRTSSPLANSVKHNDTVCTRTLGENTSAVSTEGNDRLNAAASTADSKSPDSEKAVPTPTAPITATVTGEGHAGRKRKADHVVWLNAASDSDALDEDEEAYSSDDNLSQMAVEHHNARMGKRKKVHIAEEHVLISISSMPTRLPR